MKLTSVAFFRSSITKYVESLFTDGQIDSVTCEQIRAWSVTSDAAAYARELFRKKITFIPVHRIGLQLKKLREMNGKEFNHIEVVFIQNSERPRRRCFVGHRFSKPVAETLRWNLRQILEPYNVELEWSGRDIRSVQILQDILAKIKAADFCIFDDREATGKPNVYIEAGMCIALEKPFILFEHEPTHRAAAVASPIPSDLSHALALRYKSYRQLFWEFYARLPLFFEKNLTGQGAKTRRNPRPSSRRIERALR
jgi:hypothetical protein